MSQPEMDVQQELLEQSRRQTVALEALHTYFMRFLAALTLLALIGLIALLSR